MCIRRKLRVNVGKSKVMVFDRMEAKVCDFSAPSRVGVPVAGSCKVVLNGERLEKKEFIMSPCLAHHT